MTPPTVVLWGAAGELHARAAACRALGWIVTGVVASTADESRGVAADLGTEPLTAAALRAGRVADLAVVERGDRLATDDIAHLLNAGYHLVVGPPLARSPADADAIVAAADRAWARRVATLYGDAFCASPVIDQLLERVGALGTSPTHVSSRAILLRPPRPDAATVSPMTSHGASGVAAILLVARLCGFGRLRQVVGRAASGDGAGLHPGVTDLELRFESGPAATVHASWGASAAPVRDVQVATPEEVWRVEMFPTPTIERNGEPFAVRRPGGAGDDPMYALGYTPQLHGFWSDISAGRRPVLPPAFGRDVVEVLTAGDRSASGDVPVELPRA